MESNSTFPVNSQTEYIKIVSRTCEVPNSFIKMMVRFGLVRSVSIVINRLRYRIMCRILYNLDFLKTLQIYYNQLKASKVVLWIIRKSMTLLWLRKLLWKIEMHYRGDCKGTFTSLRNSKTIEKDILESSLFNLYNHNL